MVTKLVVTLPIFNSPYNRVAEKITWSNFKGILVIIWKEKIINVITVTKQILGIFGSLAKYCHYSLNNLKQLS